MKGTFRALILVLLSLLVLSGAFAPSLGAPATNGPPSALSVSLVPPQIPADGKVYPAVIVSLLSSSGKPTLALNDTTVFLTSSQLSVGTVTPQVVISAGRSYQLANFSTTTTPGATTITASSSGLTSGSGVLNVIVPSPFALKIFAQPSPLPPSTAGRLVISLTDRAGNPARAPSDITVTITSSNNTVLSAQSTAVIMSGQIYAVSSLQSGTVQGTAELTASSPGIKSDFAAVSVTRGGAPVALKLFVSPTTVLADGSAYSSVVVGLTDISGAPSLAASDVQVTLTSADASVGDVNKTITISAGSDYAVAIFSSTYLVGSTAITASAQNMMSASATISTLVGSTPSQLAVYVGPANTIQSAGGDDALLSVQVQDSTGLPAIVKANTTVVVTASNSSVFSKPMMITIEAGENYAVAYLTAVKPGTSVLTASAPGLVSSSVTVSIAPVPFTVSLTPSPPVATIGEPVQLTVSATYFGVPMPNANVSLAAGSGQLTPASGVTDKNGQFTSVFVSGQTGAATVTATIYSPIIGTKTATNNVLVITPTPGGGKVTSNSFGLVFLILPVVIVVVFLGLLVFMVRRTLRARKRAAEGSEEGATGQGPKES
jgi:hypothetical protein